VGEIMAELPIAPIGRIMKNAGAHRVSDDARNVVARYVEEDVQKVTSYSVKLAKHAGRKTVNAADVQYAIYHNK
jgi:histone H3/H4